MGRSQIKSGGLISYHHSVLFLENMEINVEDNEAKNILENMKIAFYKWNPEGNFEQWLEENKKEQ